MDNFNFTVTSKIVIDRYRIVKGKISESFFKKNWSVFLPKIECKIQFLSISRFKRKIMSHQKPTERLLKKDTVIQIKEFSRVRSFFFFKFYNLMPSNANAHWNRLPNRRGDSSKATLELSRFEGNSSAIPISTSKHRNSITLLFKSSPCNCDSVLCFDYFQWTIPHPPRIAFSTLASDRFLHGILRSPSVSFWRGVYCLPGEEQLVGSDLISLRSNFTKRKLDFFLFYFFF